MAKERAFLRVGFQFGVAFAGSPTLDTQMFADWWRFLAAGALHGLKVKGHCFKWAVHWGFGGRGRMHVARTLERGWRW